MSLNPTDRLKKYNASAPAGEISRECVSLFHSSFSQDWHLSRWQTSFNANVRGSSVEFIPHPFAYRLPADAATGRMDVEVDFFNDGQFVKELRAAGSDATNRIVIEYNVYLDANSDSQIDPLVMEIIQVPFTTQNATCTATRTNVMSRKFPTKLYQLDEFPGLSR